MQGDRSRPKHQLHDGLPGPKETHGMGDADRDAVVSEESRVIVREINRSSDLAFIHSTWRNALWYSNEENKNKEPFRDFKTKIAKEINDLFAVRDTDVRIACLSSDPDTIIGCSILSDFGANLEFVYVKFDYRSNGIGRLLTKGFETISPPFTRLGKTIVEKLALKEKAYGRTEEKEAQDQA